MFRKLMNRPPKAPAPNPGPSKAPSGGDEKRPPSLSISEKTKSEAPATYEEAKPLFWQRLEAHDSQGVTAALANLSKRDCKRMVHEPKITAPELAEAAGGVSAAGKSPERPLCVAAAGGALSVMQALLSAGALPYAGDPFKENVPLTALFWAAAYGRRECMDFLTDVEGLSADQVMLAVQTEPTATAVAWLRNRNIEGAAFNTAMLRATNNNKPEYVKHLVEWGKASPDMLMRAADPTGDYDDFQTLLCYAIERNKIDVAKALVDLKANPDGKVKGLFEEGPKLEKAPLCLAMKGYASSGGSEAFLDLFTKLLRAGASAEYKHVKQALGLGDKASTLVVSLLRDGGVAPTTVNQASELLKLAEAAKLPRIVGIARDLRTMLEHGVTWKDSESEESKSPLVARARERILELCEADDEDMDWMPTGASMLNTSTDLVGTKKGKATQLANTFGFGRRDYAAEADAATQGALVSVKKKRFLGN